MKLKIVSFIRYRNYTLNIPNEQITLLNGESGTGKSTIIKAIRWCLFGGLAHGQKYEVHFAMKGIKIIRTSKPQTLLIIDKNGKEPIRFSGAEAQQLITQYFGPEEMFDLCSYTKQKNLTNPLFSPSSQERLIYLSKFAFRGQEDPLLLINRIEEELKSHGHKYELEQENYEAHKKLLRVFEEEEPLPTEAFSLSVKGLKEKLARFSHQLTETESKYLANEKQKEVVRQLEKQVASLQQSQREHQDRLKNADGDGTDSEKNITKELENLTHLKTKITIDQIFAELDMLKKQLPNNREDILFSERDYYHLETQHQNYHLNYIKCSKWKTKYSESAIKERIKMLMEAEQYQKVKRRHGEYLKLKERLMILTGKLQSRTFHQESLKLHNMKESLKTLKCPHCRGLVRLGDSSSGARKLIPADESITVNEDMNIEYQEELVKELQKTEQQIINISSQIKTHEKDGDHLFKYQESLESLCVDDEELSGLKSIVIVPQPQLSLEQGKILLNYHKKKKETENLQRPSFLIEDFIAVGLGTSVTDITSINHNLITEQLEKKISDTKHQLLAIQQKAAESRSLRDILSYIDNQLPQFIKQLEDERSKVTHHDYETYQRVLKRLINETTQKLHQGQRARLIIKRREALEKQYNDFIDTQRKLEDLVKLRENTIEHHRSYLQRAINSINQCIAHGIHQLFSYPLTVALNLTSSSKARYQVTYTIISMGEDYSKRNPEDALSGGELNRLSLLVLIALNRLCRFKYRIVMFDEVFASLNHSFRKDCLRLIRSHLGGATIISAEHFAEKGYYDHFIDIQPAVMRDEDKADDQ